SQRFARFGHPNAPLQPSLHMQGDKNTALLGEDSFGGDDLGKPTMQNGFAISLAGYFEGGAPVCFREAQHPETSCGLGAYATCAAARSCRPRASRSAAGPGGPVPRR